MDNTKVPTRVTARNEAASEKHEQEGLVLGVPEGGDSTGMKWNC